MIYEIGLKAGAVLSTTGIAVLNVTDPIAAGKDIGGFTTAEVLGVVAVSCVVGMVALYWQQQKQQVESRKAHNEHTDRLYRMIETNTSAARESVDVSRELVQAVSEMKNEIVMCRAARQ